MVARGNPRHRPQRRREGVFRQLSDAEVLRIERIVAEAFEGLATQAGAAFILLQEPTPPLNRVCASRGAA